MPAPIEDYAMVGDGHTAALIARNGSVDWLCWPRFDSGACFAALLGTPEHGRWLIAPDLPEDAAPPTITRRYRGDTLILETDFETPDGAVTIVDFMPRAKRPLGTRAHRGRPARHRADEDGTGPALRLRLRRCRG